MVCTEDICQGTGADNENVAVAVHQKGTTFTVYPHVDARDRFEHQISEGAQVVS